MTENIVFIKIQKTIKFALNVFFNYLLKCNMVNHNVKKGNLIIRVVGVVFVRRSEDIKGTVDVKI